MNSNKFILLFLTIILWNEYVQVKGQIINKTNQSEWILEYVQTNQNMYQENIIYLTNINPTITFNIDCKFNLSFQINNQTYICETKLNLELPFTNSYNIEYILPSTNITENKIFDQFYPDTNINIIFDSNMQYNIFSPQFQCSYANLDNKQLINSDVVYLQNCETNNCYLYCNHPENYVKTYLLLSINKCIPTSDSKSCKIQYQIIPKDITLLYITANVNDPIDPYNDYLSLIRYEPTYQFQGDFDTSNYVTYQCSFTYGSEKQIINSSYSLPIYREWPYNSLLNCDTSMINWNLLNKKDKIQMTLYQTITYKNIKIENIICNTVKVKYEEHPTWEYSGWLHSAGINLQTYDILYFQISTNNNQTIFINNQLIYLNENINNMITLPYISDTIHYRYGICNISYFQTNGQLNSTIINVSTLNSLIKLNFNNDQLSVNDIITPSFYCIYSDKYNNTFYNVTTQPSIIDSYTSFKCSVPSITPVYILHSIFYCDIFSPNCTTTSIVHIPHYIEQPIIIYSVTNIQNINSIVTYEQNQNLIIIESLFDTFDISNHIQYSCQYSINNIDQLKPSPLFHSSFNRRIFECSFPLFNQLNNNDILFIEFYQIYKNNQDMAGWLTIQYNVNEGLSKNMIILISICSIIGGAIFLYIVYRYCRTNNLKNKEKIKNSNLNSPLLQQ
jgi:hypothetical protein